MSADQKPSLFNNASTTGTYVKKGRKAVSVNENFANARQRYTILTVSSTDCTYSGDGTGDPPTIFILFKGKKDGRIKNLLAEMDLPGWLHIQVQEYGSYREEDVIDALRELLPVAASTRESKVVLLDWFSAHRTDAVVEFVESRGHVILWHGGGCTPITQHNDTHIHAILQRILVRLENRVTHAERVDMHLNNRCGVASLKRTDIVDIVMTAWKMLNHKSISEKGYEQTGPRLPLTGPIRREQVYKDLRPVLDEIDPPIGLQEVGQKLRDDARAFVEAGFGSKWSRWEHCKRLIIEHDDEDDPLPEGLEMATFDYVDSESEFASEVEIEDGDANESDGAVADSGVAGDGAAGAAGVKAESATDASEGVARVISVAEATEVLINKARRDRDDVSLKRLLKQREEASAVAKAAATDTAIVLQKVALAELEQRKKQRQAAKEEQAKAKLDEKLSEQRKAEATERTTALKLQILQAESKAHDKKMAEAAAKESARATEQWMQVEYPRALAKNLISKMSSPADATVFSEMVKDLGKQNWFRFLPLMPSLWEVNLGLLIRHSGIAQYGDGHPRVVRCSATFDAFLDEVHPIKIGGAKDALDSLRRLLERSAPGSPTIIFGGTKSLHRMLHLNDYVLDKTYVCCIVLISKWLSRKRFPDGVYEWPPKVPASLLPVVHHSSAAASSSSPVAK